MSFGDEAACAAVDDGPFVSHTSTIWSDQSAILAAVYAAAAVTKDAA